MIMRQQQLPRSQEHKEQMAYLSGAELPNVLVKSKHTESILKHIFMSFASCY